VGRLSGELLSSQLQRQEARRTETQHSKRVQQLSPRQHAILEIWPATTLLTSINSGP
jgi:hypothetical protein